MSSGDIYSNCFLSLKGTVHPKTHPQVDPNLYECVCSEHKGRYSEESV